MATGLHNAPATFQISMNYIFQDVISRILVINLVDKFIVSKTMEDHIKHLKPGLERLEQN